MTDPTQPQPHPEQQPPDQGTRPRGPKRRPSLDDVFGDVLPDVTSDERPPGTGPSGTDHWYQENRPPHHEPR